MTNRKPAEINERDVMDIMVDFGGDCFKIPEGMSYDDGIAFLRKRKEQEETVVNINELVHAFPLDGAVALARVLKRRFGWTDLVPQMSFFGPQRPSLVGVDIGYKKSIQVPWGNMSVPKINGILKTGYEVLDNGLPIFRIGGEVTRLHENLVKQIADEVRKEVQTNSIYQGKAIKLNFRDGDGNRLSEFGPAFKPEFIDTEGINRDELVLASDTAAEVQVNLFNPIQHTQQCRDKKIPLKRGVLLHGQFGVGKSLTNKLLSSVAVENGWTFLYLEDARDIDLALGYAQLYQPCVLFAEDIDRVVSGSRDANMDRLLNSICGIDAKNREVVVALTTNNLGAIHPGFLRPGRLDAVIEVKCPDLGAVVRLVRQYGQGLIEATDDEIGKAMKPMVGVNAAFVREVVERSKLAGISSKSPKISASDLASAVAAMKSHVQLLYPDAGKFDLAFEEEVDPVKFAFEVMTEQFVSGVLTHITSPDALRKIIKKKKPISGGFSAN